MLGRGSMGRLIQPEHFLSFLTYWSYIEILLIGKIGSATARPFVNQDYLPLSLSPPSPPSHLQALFDFTSLILRPQVIRLIRILSFNHLLSIIP